MKTGIITFHAAHNYGAMLQAYALQQTVMAMGHECEIINFRTLRQIDFYRPLYREHRLGSKLKALIYPSLAIADSGKHKKFEKFLEERLRLSSRQFSTKEELEAASFNYDAVICGSDQIWNTDCFDFDEAYLLPFVKNARKISYAPSMGAHASDEFNPAYKDMFKNLLSRFDYISVREQAASGIIEKLCGRKAEVVIDPTLLLNRETWEAMCGSEPMVDGDYIFFYSPLCDLKKYNEAIAIASELRVRLVLSTPYWYHQYHRNTNVEYRVNCGPQEFLNLTKYSRMVIGSSFHAVAFSIIFGKQFYAIDGLNDIRISQLLNRMTIERFAVRPDRFLADYELKRIYQKADNQLSAMINGSKAYLEKALSE